MSTAKIRSFTRSSHPVVALPQVSDEGLRGLDADLSLVVRALDGVPALSADDLDLGEHVGQTHGHDVVVGGLQDLLRGGHRGLLLPGIVWQVGR